MSNYTKSNAITDIPFNISKQTKIIFKKLMKNTTEKLRSQYGEELLDNLCDQAKIDIVNIKISKSKQYHKKSKGKTVYKQYGYYKPQSNYIYIHNRTAVRGQILASKTFCDTLLHEWMHHYDFKKLGLNSIHTSGFYARLKDLKTKLGYFD